MIDFVRFATFPAGWNRGVYYVETVGFEANGNRETLKQFDSLKAGCDFTRRATAFLAGEYDSEVFDALNAIEQARAEGEAA
jgi:hypothetical protein